MHGELYSLGSMLAQLLIALLLAPPLHAHVLLRTDCRGDVFSYDDVRRCGEDAAVVIPWTSGNACQCVPPTTTFRLDTGDCVNKLHECPQVPLDENAVEPDIPLVASLFHGHPVRFKSHLAIHKVIHFENFACRVAHEKFLSSSGWLPLSNVTYTAQFHFQLVEMTDRQIALNFLGSDDESWRLEGKLIRVGLSCQSAEKANIVPQPCIAFRVGGSHQANDDFENEIEDNGGLNKWLIIALGAGLLGVTYVLAILVYVLIRKRNEEMSEEGVISRLSSLSSSCVQRCRKKPSAHRKRLCEHCMTSSSVLRWVNQSQFECKELSKEDSAMANVTVVSINGPPLTSSQQKRLSRSKSDVGLTNGQRKALAAKRSESMLHSKCVSFDPHDVIIDQPGQLDAGKKLVTFASLPSVRDDDDSPCKDTGPASILKKSSDKPVPPRFLLTSFNRKQRRVPSEEEPVSGKSAKLSDDLGYHSGDSERLTSELTNQIDFSQGM